jgi:DNA-binding GntR family transcriptional regulator
MLAQVLEPRPLKRVNLSDRVCDLLREQIIRGRLAPGEKLDIFTISEKLHVSRTPVKEAFNRLILERLVTIRPQSGTFVTTLGAEEIEHLFDVRLMMELWGAWNALKRWDALELRGFQDVLDRCDQLLSSKIAFDYEAFTNSDQELHMRIVNAARNPQSSKIYLSLNPHIQIMSAYWGRARERALKSHNEHIRICKAFRRGSETEVRRPLTAHIVSSRDDILKLLREEKHPLLQSEKAAAHEAG